MERADNSRTRENGLKLRQGRFRLDVRGKFFAMRAVRCRDSCPERLWMPRPSLEVFKARLDGALGFDSVGVSPTPTCHAVGVTERGPQLRGVTRGGVLNFGVGHHWGDTDLLAALGCDTVGMT